MTDGKGNPHRSLLIVWEDEYRLGISRIDAQHRALFDLINDFFSAVQGRHGSQAVQETLKALIAYAQTHFAAEEEVMARTRYPGYGRHARLHEKLAQKVSALSSQHQEGREDLVMDLLRFLKSWLTKHILHEDMKVASFLRNQSRVR